MELSRQSGRARVFDIPGPYLSLVLPVTALHPVLSKIGRVGVVKVSAGRSIGSVVIPPPLMF